MARKPSFIHEIDDTRETWKLAVRIMDLWFVQRTQKYGTIEMVLLDEKRDKIHAVVPNLNLDKWKAILQEGKTYIIQNFEVQRNDGHFIISNHVYKLFFTKATIVKDYDLPAIPNYVYHFTKFEDIINGHASPDVLVDILGEFVECDSCQIEKKPKVVFFVKDERNNKLNCTLWDEYAIKLAEYLKKHESGPVVLLLTHAKIKDFQGQYPTTVTNSKFSSKLFVNDENIEEILKYKNSLDTNNVYESFSQSMTQLSSCCQGSSKNRFFQKAEVMSLTEINSLKKECQCITLATIDKFLVNSGWSYHACSKCNKKANPQDVPYMCGGCHKNITETIRRFRIEINVSDKKESLKFCLWDRECCQLLNHTAADLKQELEDQGEMEEDIFPQALDSMLQKTVAFKLKFQPDYKRCSVIQVSEELEIIEAIKNKISVNEDSVTVDKGKSICSLPNEDELYDSQSFSATADFDPGLIDSLTPAKRVNSSLQFDELGTQDHTSGQLSSTKVAKHIKSE